MKRVIRIGNLNGLKKPVEVKCGELMLLDGSSDHIDYKIKAVKPYKYGGIANEN